MTSIYSTHLSLFSQPSNAQRIFTDRSLWCRIVDYLDIIPWEKSKDKTFAVKLQDLLSLAVLQRQASEAALRSLWKRKDGLIDICCVINSGTDDKYIIGPGKDSNRWQLKRPLPNDVQKRAQLYLSFIRHLRISPYEHEDNLWSVLTAALSGRFLLPNLHKLTLFNFCRYGKIKLIPLSPLLSPSIKVLEYGHGVAVTEDEISMIHSILHGYGTSLNSVTFSGSYIGDPPIPIRHIMHPAHKNNFTFILNEICPPLLHRFFDDILQPLSLSKTLTCFKFSIHQDPRFPEHVWKLHFDREDKTQLRFQVLQELHLGWNAKYLELDHLFGRLDCPELQGLYIDINDISSWKPLFDSLTRYHKLERLKIWGRYRKEVKATMIFEIKDLEGILNKTQPNVIRLPRLPLRVLDLDIPQSQLTYEDIVLVLSSFPFLDTLLLSGSNSKQHHPSILPSIVGNYGMGLKDLCLPVDLNDQQYHYTPSQPHLTITGNDGNETRKMTIDRLWFRNGSTLPESLENQKRVSLFLSSMFWSLQTQSLSDLGLGLGVEMEIEDYSEGVNSLDDLCKSFREHGMS